MESCVIIGNEMDLVKDKKVLEERVDKLRLISEYFDITSFYLCSLKKDPPTKIKEMFKEVCTSLWKNKLCDPRYIAEFKVNR